MTGRQAPPPVTGIILAGGRSRRFGSDKLTASLHGRPLLARAIESVASVAAEVIVVIAAEGPEPLLPPLDRPIRIARDPVAGGGPLVALLAGLRETATPIALVIGGDMPLVRREVLELLVARLRIEDTDEAPALSALVEARELRPLPAALRVDAARTAAERLVADGLRSLRSLAGTLAAERVDEAAWRRLDPDAGSLRDVDTPIDLAALEDAGSRRSV